MNPPMLPDIRDRVNEITAPRKPQKLLLSAMLFSRLLSLASATVLLPIALRLHAAPIATNDTYSATEDTPLTVAVPGVLGNDTADPPGASLKAEIASQPAHGAVLMNTDGSFTYTPAANYHGPDSFTYRVTGGRAFTVDRARSVVNVAATIDITDPDLGEKSDAENANIAGNAQVFLNPAAPPLQQIQIQNLDVALDSAVTLDFSWLFGGARITATIDPRRATDPDSLRITMAQPGPAAAIAANGNFSQNGNLLNITGRARLAASGPLLAGQEIPPQLDIDSPNTPYGIAPIQDEPALGSPQITQVGNNLELKLPVKVTRTEEDPDGRFNATIVVKGTIYFTAPLNPLPQSSTATVTLNVAAVDDPPDVVNDRYYTRRNLTLPVPATIPQRTDELIAAGSVWKYITGANQGTAWRAPEFNDSAWASGAGILGYGDNDIITTVPARANVALPANDISNPNYPTAYFRRDFTLTSALDTVLPSIEILRDDAAIVYVNGTEVYRDKDPYAGSAVAPLPATGDLPYSQYADAALPEADETIYKSVTFSRSVLREGRNVVAVEVKQASATSTDLRFDLKASRLRGVAGVLSNDTDADGDPLTAQLRTGAAHGTVSLQSDGAFTYTPAPGFFGTDTFSYRVLQNGQPATTEMIIVTPGAESAPGSKPVWKFLDTGVDPGTAWKDAAFDDAAWKSGPAELGYGDNDESTVVEDNPTPGYSNNPVPTDRFITTWFRKKVNIANAAAVTALRVRARRDDGIAVYLNGTRILLDNLDEPYTATKRARTSLAGTDETTFIERTVTAPTMLTEGENTLSAEVHQFAPDSSDLTFDLGLSVTYAITGFATVEVLKDDADNDLISDTWERSFGFDATVANANEDSDGDGQNNRAEFLAGTDPLNAASNLHINALLPGTPSQLNLTLATVPGRSYQLQRTADLQAWTNSGTAFPAHSSESQTTVGIPVQVGPNQFYRIKLLNDWP
ncbi:MAG TPA: Ig-like domain-containing protein [Verrucomicrobiales bacterium]|nr:Ig-like domain-containing protein [Verrucomicrobiales bacterium]